MSSPHACLSLSARVGSNLALRGGSSGSVPPAPFPAPFPAVTPLPLVLALVVVSAGEITVEAEEQASPFGCGCECALTAAAAASAGLSVTAGISSPGRTRVKAKWDPPGDVHTKTLSSSCRVVAINTVRHGKRRKMLMSQFYQNETQWHSQEAGIIANAMHLTQP